MSDHVFMVVVTAAGIVFILAYAWAQLEIMAGIFQSWHEGRKMKAAALAPVWLAMNAFALFAGPNIHFSIMKQHNLNFYGIVTPWAKAAALISIAVYWAWLAASFAYAFKRWWGQRKDGAVEGDTA